ncbi:short-chain dehydrogenase/reductase family protein [Saccharata proteae CBS 121410]|uniref:Short-chain dehydrogenase/reductase family protein n=1 Tax=Saccharata proteae CBS 121410 TaxID=1314787 RepID=A0A9P4HNC6_9PEZI|nr:short-chain dehydrogenase/reductase family protein [Saccharata proteae CBS 121410]
MSVSLLVPFFQPHVTPPPLNNTFAGKTAIVTGANSGIGKETVRQLIFLGAKSVVLAVRNTEKGEKAKEDILADPAVKAQNRDVEIRVLKLDTDSYGSVLSFVDGVKGRVEDLDLLVLNAAKGGVEFEFSPSTGHESMLQINYLSNVLLLLQLLPLLRRTGTKRAATTRITWLGSRAMNLPSTFQSTPFTSNPDSIFSFFNDMQKFVPMQRYPDTKLLGAMFIVSLAQQWPLKERGVVLDILCPGMVNTDFTDDLPWYMRVPVGILKMVRGRSVEEGAWCVVWAAVVAEGTKVDGRCAEDQRVVEPSAYMQSKGGQEVQEKLWEETLVEMGKHMDVPKELKA